MKKLFAILAVMGVLTFGTTQVALAQEEAAPATTEEQAAPAVDEAAAPEAAPVVVEEEGGIHKALKTKFIEGTASFMGLVAIALVISLAFCIERIIYLSLAEVNTKKLLKSVEEAMEKGDIEGAKDICRNTRGPIASIFYQGLMRVDQGLDVVEKSVVSYGGVQAGYLEKGCSWITLFIAMAPSLGFLGTVIGMVEAFWQMSNAGGNIDISLLSSGIYQAMITTVGGLVVGIISLFAYNYLVAKVDSVVNEIEAKSLTFMDIISEEE